MKKKYSDRMMRPQETKAPAALICKSECTVHGFGTIAAGQEVTDPTLIAYLTQHGEHPNFTSKEE